MLATITGYVKELNDIVWGPIMLALLLGTGFYLTLGLRFLTLLRLSSAFRLLWHGRKAKQSEEGELSPFNALMTALAATIGTGNIVGVATAIYLGGPGALFWMWCTALVGMATKFSEITLAVHYREVSDKGSYVGGPMYYIKNGLGANWKWLGTLFAFFGAIAGFGIGNTVQANSIAAALKSTYAIPEYATAAILVVLVASVLLGGIKRIGDVAGKVVPFMAIFYISSALLALAFMYDKIPGAFATIFDSAFNGTAVTGGFVGSTMIMAIRYGVARGVFSNEAGLGSAPIAHATAITSNPVRQALIGMLGTFLDTIVVCTMTGLVIVASGVWEIGTIKGAELTTRAFSTTLPVLGSHIVTIGLALFAFTTILGWSVYSERCVIYLFGDKMAIVYRIIYTIIVPLGAVASLDFVWLISDTFNALMAIPNLIALLMLSPVVFRLAQERITEAVNYKKD
ncbi:alanine/glycine:cation symporter family protein [Desulfovibrio litoralis]|uniref:Alanine or glycine:cation symporter, AGCS family n=1 Tax=Desulfovibrio litoralis DSM 11393 TaxID=1121455 RepID=A0A1M7S6Y2_9BACT|nr:sodium:alanine symporter family protein [Desulfovibrio litoralis]SHN54216.1 alanine or glycine:cation symporter, AGCS family [Desulfovibrio litoralis DSM 11393]